jgi:hemoglobin/transferrin/lactoferrin receptor protein
VGKQLDIVSNQYTQDASRYPDGSTLNGYAGYVNYEYVVDNIFIYQAGIRYSQYHLAAEMDTTFFKFPFQNIVLNNGAMSGGFGFIIKPKPDLTFNTNLIAGFRAPNIDDVAKVFDSEPGNVVVPNPNLKPEYAYNVDVGIDKIFSERIQVDFSAFFTYLDQAMVRRDFSYDGQDSIFYDGELSKTQAVVNASSAVIYGLYFNINTSLTKKLNLASRINYIRGHDDEQLPLRHVAPLYGSTHLVYHSKKVRVDLSADYNGTISNKNLAPTEQTKTQIYAQDDDGMPYAPGWVTANIMASYQFNRIMGINLGLENIFNVRYRPYSSGIVAPGRDFMVALRFNF